MSARLLLSTRLGLMRFLSFQLRLSSSARTLLLTQMLWSTQMLLRNRLKPPAPLQAQIFNRNNWNIAVSSATTGVPNSIVISTASLSLAHVHDLDSDVFDGLDTLARIPLPAPIPISARPQPSTQILLFTRIRPSTRLRPSRPMLLPSRTQLPAWMLLSTRRSLLTLLLLSA